MVEERPFDHVACDLSDVLGTPGVETGPRVLDRLHDDLGGSWDAPVTDGVLVAGDPGPGSLGAFAAPGARRALAEAVLTPHGAGGATRVDGLDSALGRTEVWQQVLRGAPVVGASYRVHRGPRGRLALSGRPLGDLAARDPGPRPEAPAETVRQAALESAGLPPGTDLEVEPVVFPLEGRGIWAWKCQGVVDDPVADVRVFLDADDLRLLVSYDVAARALFGEATVYQVNPARTPHPVGTRLAGLSGPDRLRGSQLVVRPARGEAVMSAIGDYRVPPAEPANHQPSAYHHAQAALRWFSDVLGPDLLTRPPLTPLTVLTDDPAVGAQVAVFVPDQRAVRLSRSPLNPALSGEVVAHEVAHAVTDGLSRLTRSPGAECRALAEGIADYAAASLHGEPRFGDHVAPAHARDCSRTDLRMPPGPVPPDDPYAVGTVWAAAMWDLRGRVGPGVADALVLHSLAYLGPGATLADGLACLLEADRALFPTPDGPGRHEADVRTCVVDRGLQPAAAVRWPVAQRERAGPTARRAPLRPPAPAG